MLTSIATTSNVTGRCEQSRMRMKRATFHVQSQVEEGTVGLREVPFLYKTSKVNSTRIAALHEEIPL